MDTEHDSFKLYTYSLLFLLLTSILLAGYLIWNYVHTVIFSIIISMLLHPFYAYLERKFKGRKSLAALTVIFCLIFLIIIPFLFFITGMSTQLLQTVNSIVVWMDEGNVEKLLKHPFLNDVLTYLRKFHIISGEVDTFENYLIEFGKSVGGNVFKATTELVGNVFGAMLRFFLMIVIVFFLLLDGRSIRTQIIRLLPLKETQVDLILTKIKGMARSVFMGSILTALCQGLAGGIGLAIVGIPALFWGTMMTFSSLIPVIGTSIISVPAVIWLFISGSWKSGVFLTIWSIVVIGGIDNFVRPIFMRGGAEISSFYIFLSILFGLSAFGIPGMLYGPIILSFFMVMISIYDEEYREALNDMNIK